MKKGIILIGLMIVGAFGIWFLCPLDRPNVTTPTWIFYDRQGEVLYAERPFFNAQSTGVGFSEDQQKSPFFYQALIAVEDQQYYEHGGVNWGSLLRAAKQNLTAGEVVSGASTIPMQSARLYYLPEADRNYWYKIRQIFYALKLDWHLSKSEILALYTQRINFGAGAEGGREAAYRYFSKTPEALTIGESAMLIGLMPNPSQFNPISNPKYAEQRKQLILDILAQRQLITKEEKNYWQRQSIRLHPALRGEIHAPHYVLWLKDRIGDQLYDDHDGLVFSQDLAVDDKPQEIHVHTTLDKAEYERVLHIVQSEIDQRSLRNHATNAAAVAIDLQTQEVRVMLGSVNFFDESIDGAVNMAQASRQTGSTLKPFLFAKALEEGMSPADEIRDERRTFLTDKGGYSPRNFDVQIEYGRVRFREALVNSYNISAVFLLDKIGTHPFFDLLYHLRIGEDQNADELGYSMILGSTEASLLNLTNAFSVFPNKGIGKDVKYFTKVTNEQDEVLLDWDRYAHGEAPDRVFSSATAEWMVHALSDEQARWKNYSRGNVLEVDFPAGAKTGTSQDFRDNWVIGFSPYYAIGVWAGNTDGTPMYTSSGVEGAGPIWNKVFRYLHRDFYSHPKSFSYSSDRKSVTICRRPYETENCAETVQEFLTPEEMDSYEKTAYEPPKFEIIYPGDGDIFHEDSALLIKVRNAPETHELHYFFDGKSTGSSLENLPSGWHEVWVESGGVRTEKIRIYVE